MGLFDWIDYETDCPKCGAKVDGFQSKDGPRRLLKLKPTQVRNYYAACPRCDHWLEFDDPNPPEPIVWCQSGGTIDEENSHVAVERSELEALRADARRFRWLKENAVRLKLLGGWVIPPIDFPCGDLCDAIDAEMAKEGDGETLTLVGTCDKALVAGDTWGTHTEFDLNLTIEAELTHEGDPMKVKSVTTSPAAIVTASFDEDGELWITEVIEPREAE